MIYLVHKTSCSTLQLPDGLSKIRALGEAFYNCEEISWSMYLYYTSLNTIKYLSSLERTIDGERFYVHNKYYDEVRKIDKKLPVASYKEEIKELLNYGKTKREIAELLGISWDQVNYCTTYYQLYGDNERDIKETRSKSPSLETVETHPGSMETLSGGE